jgi:hypothetical protein
MNQIDWTPIVEAVWSQLSWIIPAILLVVALKALRPYLRGRIGEAAVARALRRRFTEVANDLILPDGRGGLTQIDHMALTPQGILVVETKTYSGTLFGKEREPTWTQVLGRARNSFQNPLRQNFAHRKAIEALEPGAKVHALVVFAGTAHFPKGIPEGVCTLAGLEQTIAPLDTGEIPQRLRTTWDRLLQAAPTDAGARRAHLNGLRSRFGHVRRVRWAVLVAILALVWLATDWIFWSPATTRPGQATSGGLSAPISAAPVPPTPVPVVNAIARSPTMPAATGQTGAVMRTATAATTGPGIPKPVASIEWTDPRTQDDR